MEFKKFKKKGQVGAVNVIVALIVGVGVATLILIFIGALGGQTFNLVQSDINAINDTTIKASVLSAITSGFSSLEQVGNYMPILILAVIIAVVLSLVLGLQVMNRGGDSDGTAL